MDRETKEITLTSGIKVIIYSYMITREMFEIKNLSNKDANEYSIKQFIVSFDGVTEKEKIYEMVMNTKISDFKGLDRELAVLLEPLFDKKKL